VKSSRGHADGDVSRLEPIRPRLLPCAVCGVVKHEKLSHGFGHAAGRFFAARGLRLLRFLHLISWRSSFYRIVDLSSVLVNSTSRAKGCGKADVSRAR